MGGKKSLKKFDTAIHSAHSREIAKKRAESNLSENDLKDYWEKELQIREKFFSKHGGPWDIGRIVREVEDLCFISEDKLNAKARTVGLMTELSFAHKKDFDRISVYGSYFKEIFSKRVLNLPEETLYTHQHLSSIKRSLEERIDELIKSGNDKFLEGRVFIRERDEDKVSVRGAFEAAFGRDKAALTEEDLVASFEKKREMYWDKLKKFDAMSFEEVEAFGEALLCPRSLDRVFFGDQDSYIGDLKKFERLALKSLIKRRDYDRIGSFFSGFKSRAWLEDLEVYAFNNFSSLLSQLELRVKNVLPGFKELSTRVGIINDFLENPSPEVMSTAKDFFSDDNSIKELVFGLGFEKQDELIQNYMKVLGSVSEIWENGMLYGQETRVFLNLRELVEGFVLDWSSQLGMKDLDLSGVNPLGCIRLGYDVARFYLKQFESSLKTWREIKNQKRDASYFL
ncbi:MAG: hypothetical protein GOU97_01515 [Nanoarchaeota archaeon]|nr:hypothetical protein [Nanoarchaeota archaeon]